jgi:quinol-cytochrome oxidoreductase complex cytochrome b subunit
MTDQTRPATPPAGIGGWLDQRLRVGPVLQAAMHVRVPMAAQTFYFGGIALFLFGVQTVTGTLLALYYKPTPDAAYESVKFITSDVSFGWLIRSVHHWGANLMIVFVVFHLLRIFFQAAYKYPREITWVVGVGLLGMTLAFGFTGYLLPWDQKAYWATVVGTEIAGSVPLVGESLLLLLRGGVDVTEATLSRFFGIHVLALPIIIAGLLAIHLVLVHQLGLAHPRRPEPRPGRGSAVAANTLESTGKAGAEKATDERLRPFWPHYLLDELIAWYVLLAILVVMASMFPAGLEEEANALETPAHIKPEWYFLGVYELLKHVPRIVGILVPVVGIGLLVVWPFLDRSPEVLARRRLLAVGGATLVVAALVFFTIWGYVS